MNWRVIRAFPKYAIVVGVIVISTALFGLWWYLRQPKQSQGSQASAKAAEVQKKAQSLPEKLGWLALVGTDLYNIQTGELLFPAWLRGVPQRVFYHPESNRLLVQAENGIIRFGLDGKQDGVMAADSPPAFTNDGKQAMWIKNGDIWIASLDWTGFKFRNERQATHYGQFYAPYFNANVVLASEGACIVKTQRRPLRVDFQSGDLKEMTLPLDYPGKMRSPDCQMMVGGTGEKIFAYDVNKPDAAYFERSDRVNDSQWLNNDSCVVLMGGKSASLYDRKKGTLSHVVDLPFLCSGIERPSPDGRYMLVGGKPGLLLLDTKQKKVLELGVVPRHMLWVSNDTFIFQRDVPDMKLRGTWLKTVGSPERQVMAEPYLVGYDKTASVALLEGLNYVVFSTREALFRMRPDGSELQEFAKPRRPGGVIQGVRKWGE